MKTPPALLAAALVTLTGCPSSWPQGQFSADHWMDEPSRIHSWAFAPPVQPGVLDPLRWEIGQRLTAAGWIEAPADQAEFLVETTEVIGQPEWVDGTPPGLVMMAFASDVMALAAGDEPSGPPEPRPALSWPRYLRVRLVRQVDDLVLYEGRASALDGVPEGSTLAAALARELLISFPGKTGAAWTAALRPYPVATPSRPARSGGAVVTPALPARLTCSEAVPVVAFRKARLWATPDPTRAVAFKLEAVTAGCATTAARGLVHVALADGRSGFISSGSLRFHAGP